MYRNSLHMFLQISYLTLKYNLLEVNKSIGDKFYTKQVKNSETYMTLHVYQSVSCDG